jgi:hypothetical protein
MVEILYGCPICTRRHCRTLGAVCEGCRIVASSQRRQGSARAWGICFYCKEDHLVVDDHVVPIVRGGPPDEAWNIVKACDLCNSSKSDQLPSEWCPDNAEAIEIEKRVPTIYPRMRYGFLLGDHEQAFARVRAIVSNFLSDIQNEMRALPASSRKRAISLHRRATGFRIHLEDVINTSEAKGYNEKREQ